ncbi:pilus assembly protein PilM [Paenibacillus sp. sgz302251]|uniref:pilus assembly protein PilM n=1 Tax=Paenibacillus sp. sgz302251 TaxID=3414493 RepID=UPI003C7ADD44
MFARADHIGLTVDHTGVRYARAKKKKTWEMESYGYMPFEAGWIEDDHFTAVDELSSRLKQWVKQEKLIGTAVTLSVPTSQVIIRKLQIEASNPKELKQLVELEVETTLHLPFENPVYDYINVSAKDGYYDVLIFASPQKWILQCVEVLESAGLKVRHSELASSALARAMQEERPAPLTSAMLINLDKSNTEVYMFHNGYPVFMRVMNEYEQLTIDEEGLSPELIASMNAEVSRLLNFYQYSIHEGQSRITHTTVTGNIKGRDQFISEFRLLHPDMQVDTFDFGSGSGSKNDVNEDEFRIPFGLAIRESKSKEINLLPERVISKQLLSAQLLIAGGVWLLCFIAIIFLYTNSQSKITKQELAAQALMESNAALEEQLVSLNQQNKTATDPESVIKSIIENRQDAVFVFDYLYDKLPPGAVIQTVEYSKPGAVALIVKFSDMQHIADYLHELRIMPFSGGALLQGFSGTDAEWTARFQMKWKNEQAAKTEELPQEEGALSNG